MSRTPIATACAATARHANRCGWRAAWLVTFALTIAGCNSRSTKTEVDTPVKTAPAQPTLPSATRTPTSEPAEPPAPTQADTPVQAPLEPATALPFAYATLDQDAILKVLSDAQALRFRPVGTSSVVFRATLQADFDAAFKSSSEKRPRAHAAEVAAYRLARLLGLDNVPPAITRRFTSEVMRSRLIPPGAWNELRGWIGEDAGQVKGAAIYWIADIHESGIDTRAGTRRYTEWLRHDGVIADNERMLARDVSNMVAFDCLIGNWDRWSGGNTKGDASGQRLYIRDHDVAFPGRLSEDLQRRILDRLTPVERFSKRFVDQLRRLTRSAFEAELALDPDGAALIDARQIAGMLDRREAVLSHVDALIALRGEESVLTFP